MSPFGWHPPHLVNNTDTLSGEPALTRDSVGFWIFFLCFCVHLYFFISVSFWTPGDRRKFFLKFGKLLEVHMKLCVTELDFRRKIFFCPKIEKKGPKEAKNMVFSICWKIWWLIFTEFCTNPILGKVFVPEIWPKCSQPIRLQDFLINYISRINQWNSLIFCMLI